MTCHDKGCPDQQGDWYVLRRDDLGNMFIVKAKLSHMFAEATAASYNQKGHHQTYWAQQAPLPPDITARILV